MVISHNIMKFHNSAAICNASDGWWDIIEILILIPNTLITHFKTFILKQLQQLVT